MRITLAILLLATSCFGQTFFPTSIMAPTNVAWMDVSTNLFVLGTRYTNGARRAFISASVQLNAAVAGTAAVTLYVENVGVATNTVSVSAGPLASLTAVHPIFAFVSPGSIYYINDTKTGVGASVSLIATNCSVTAF